MEQRSSSQRPRRPTASRQRRGSAGPPTRRRRRSTTGRRVLVAMPWIVIALVAIYVGEPLFLALLLVLGVAALGELYGLLRRARPVALAGILGMAALVLAAHYGDQFQMVLALALSVLVTFLLMLARGTRRYATLAIAVTMLGVVWVGLGLAHAVLLRDLDHGDGLIIDVLLATFIGDTGAYFGGRLWGMRPLAPHISPNKTVEGLIAGFIAGTLAFWLAGLYQDWLSGLDALAIGACVAAVAPLGDLFESLIKRDLGVKDTGRFFGVHGGVLDRLDAAFFTVVVAYYMAVALI
ncbi:MAG: phosphatidate cytidylyltransferase [Solirubrobacterales bacterium]